MSLKFLMAISALAWNSSSRMNALEPPPRRYGAFLKLRLHALAFLKRYFSAVTFFFSRNDVRCLLL